MGLAEQRLAGLVSWCYALVGALAAPSAASASESLGGSRGSTLRDTSVEPLPGRQGVEGPKNPAVAIRERLPLAVASAALAVSLSIAAPASAACRREEGKHCYITEYFRYSVPLEAGIADIETSQMDAPPSLDRMQNEMWTYTEGGSWIEVGDTIGQIGFGEGSGEHYTGSPVYFWAYFPDPDPPYTGTQEWDLGSGPALGEWFEVNEVAAGSGVWCAKINGVQMGCGGGFSEYGDDVESGLEVYGDIPPESVVNSGTSKIYRMNLAGEVEAAETKKFLKARSNVWCYEFPADGHDNWIDYGTGDFECAQHTDAAILHKLEGGGEPLTSTLTSTRPNEGYVRPSGPKLSTTDLRKLALQVSATEGHDATPTDIEEVPVDTLQQAAEVVDPDFKAPPATSVGMAEWYNAEVDVIVLRGHFSLDSAPTSRFATGVPTGTVLDLIVDAHTGAIDSTRIDERAPESLSALGRPEVLAK
jgi:hypothetical protein